jgi:DtxR family transcriptional regulator, Mn-dependent transcriptional regulator
MGRDRPIVLPCHGASSGGVSALDVAHVLEAHGLAEMLENVEEIVAAAREGREVIALDACAGNCRARLLDARNVPTLRALNLDGETPGGKEVADATSIGELEAATSPVRRTRRSLPVPSGELGGRSHSHDDYLLALDTLTSPVVECGAIVDAPTLAAHVAQLLGISRPAAGEMLARLEDDGFITRGAHKDVMLTPRGRREADRIVRKQRILECFAAGSLGYPVDECFERAREIAPGFGDEALDRVWAAVGRPTSCPHGWPIDPERSRQESRGLFALSAAPPATAVMVERVDEMSSERLRALRDAGIEPGGRLSEVTVNAAAGMVGFARAPEPRRSLSAMQSISLVLAGAVLVRAA